jgi:hypothetical protein
MLSDDFIDQPSQSSSSGLTIEAHDAECGVEVRQRTPKGKHVEIGGIPRVYTKSSSESHLSSDFVSSPTDSRGDEGPTRKVPPKRPSKSEKPQPKRRLTLETDLGEIQCEPVVEEPGEPAKPRKRRRKVHHGEDFPFLKRPSIVPTLQRMSAPEKEVNYLEFLQQQRLKLVHIQKGTNASRQMRALRQSHVVEMEYTYA